MRFYLIVFLSALFSPFSTEASSIQRTKNIAYLSGGSTAHLLDVYSPKDRSQAKDVLVFIHGGSWSSGKKETYRFFGKGFARKNVVTVVINYRLAPEVLFDQMAEDCAAAVSWVKMHIAEYGGDPNRIFLAGHSAGGHLAALISSNREYFENLGLPMPVKGAMLIDAFGLDMYQYFTEIDPSYSSQFYPSFTSDPMNWQRGTPLNYVERSQVAFVGFVGERTYPGIKLGTSRFQKRLEEEGRSMQVYTIPKRKHIGMITQFFFKKNPMYTYCLNFMQEIR